MLPHPFSLISRNGRPAVFLMAGALSTQVPCAAQTLYDFGNPSAEEQQYIEYINRARANPAAEGGKFATTTDPSVLFNYSYYSVNLTTMQSEFNALTPQPPLAPNAKLMGTSRSHSAWMLANALQAHDETNPDNTPWDRVTDAGYDYSSVGENVFAYAANVWHGHAGFEVDWGSGGTGGMQNGRGHRANIHSSLFREIGVGVVLGSNTTVSPAIGPQLVTQDFGTQFDNPTFGTGVAYYDLNGNNFYDIGEGISGLTVNVSGASYYCNTATGGGWVVPIPTNATTRTVTFSGLGMNQPVSLTVPASTNAKADLKLSYPPPSINSASTATDGSSHTLTFTGTAGSTGYMWKRSSVAAAGAENCESTSTVTSTTTGTYAVRNTTVKQQGTSSFHLFNATGANQTLELNTVYFGNTSPSISFQSRLAYSWTSEKYKMQVKEEGSLEWQDAYTQTGTGTSGESVFNLRTASIPGMTGKAFRIRFVMNFSGGSYGSAGENSTGWFIDAIGFTGISALSGTVSQSLAGTSGSFTPATGNYLMSVAPLISGREFPAGYQTLTVSAGTITTPAISTHPASVPVANGNTANFNVTASGGSLAYQWYSGASGNTTSPIAGATSSSYTTTALNSNASFWVRVSNTAGSADSNTATATVLNPVSITSHPASTNVANGSGTTFSVTASGSSPSYQWYTGASGNTASPIAGATSNNYSTPALGSTTSYWVRVSNAVSASDSNTATATVFTAPTITTHPASTNVASGSTTTFSVVATGTTPAYQWYTGGSGDTSNPIPSATTSSYTTPALSSTTSYWVRVSNFAGSVNSNTATATVVVPPTILSQPVSTTIAKNTNTKLSVLASGPSLTYQWYLGTAPSTTSPISGATSNTYTTPTYSSSNTKKYWVRVTNGAGNVNSATSTVVTSSSSTVTRNFSVWASEIETANGLAPGALTNGNGDYDKDGRNNLVEYAFGASPIVANDAAPRMPVMQITPTQCVLQYQVDTAITDITITPVAGSTPGQWFASGAGGAPSGFTDSLISTSGGIQTRSAVLPKSSGARGFVTLRVIRP